jgi:hypothetical protein
VPGVRIPHAPPAQMTLLTNKASSSVARSVALECASRRFVTRQARRRADLRVAVASRNRSTRAFEPSPRVHEDQERAVILPTSPEVDPRDRVFVVCYPDRAGRQSVST